MKLIWTVVITVIVTAGLVGGGGFYYLNSQAEDEQATLQTQIDDLTGQVATLKKASTTSTTDDSGSTSTTTATDESDDWTLFENGDYSYSFKYPTDQNLTVSSDGIGAAADKAADITLAKNLGESSYKVIMTLRNIESGQYAGAEDNAIIDASLAEFATAYHNANLNDTNPNIENKETGELKQITINGMEAYTFTITESFATPWGGELVDEKSTVILLSSSLGKVVIHYPTSNKTTPKVLETLKITN